MKRGEIWSLRDRGYVSKPRPVVVVQSDAHDVFDSVILCLFTTYDSRDVPTRVFVEATPDNGLNENSYVMTEKMMTVTKTNLGERIGRLTAENMDEISTQLRRVLDL
ncbi:MAG: type II toxin-antitoxin system PemK/MazF family toxin [Actinomycetaceae bacterium]|nr:type II toxin-antitoxin system PemK/MazF family toxin [Actinomycetaceae bacterium]